MSFENDPQNQPTAEGERVKGFFKRLWNYIKAAKMELIVLASFFAVDLISKALVAAFMDVGQTVVIIPYVLSFTYSLNKNAAFGSTWLTGWMSAIGARIAFSIFAVAASAVFMIILVRNKGGNRVYRAGLAMLIAGALGNCVDRMFLGFVRDFVDMQLFTLMTGGWWTYIFNIADCALVVGVVLVIVYFIFLYDTEGRKARKAAKLAAKNGVVVDDSAVTANVANPENIGIENAEPNESEVNTETSETLEKDEKYEKDKITENGAADEIAETPNITDADNAADGDIEKDDTEGGA